MADAADEISIQDLAEGIDVFFLLVNTILVLMMQAGFALYEVCMGILGTGGDERME